MLGWLSAICVLAATVPTPVAKPYLGIQIIDRATGRGVPLVELRTVNDISFFTDSSGSLQKIFLILTTSICW